MSRLRQWLGKLPWPTIGKYALVALLGSAATAGVYRGSAPGPTAPVKLSCPQPVCPTPVVHLRCPKVEVTPYVKERCK